MNRKQILTALTAVLCTTASAGLLYAAVRPAPVCGLTVISEAAEAPVNDNVYALFAQVSRKPDNAFLTAEGIPDFSGMLVTVTAQDAEGRQFDIVRDATIETAQAHLLTEIHTEPADPSGARCRITFSVYNSKTQQTLSADVSLRFKDPPETTAPVTATTNVPQGTASVPAKTTAPTSTSAAANTTARVLTTAAQATTVPAATSAPAETTAVTSVTTAAQNTLSGDCNADGSFNIADVVLLCKWLAHEADTVPAWYAADLDGNSRLTANDLALMKRELLIQKPVYPVENPAVIDVFTAYSPESEETAFSDWRIHVVIKHQYSVPSRKWTKEDFSGVENIKSVKQYDQAEPYRQLLEITLKQPSEENVLKLIRSIEALGLAEIKEVRTVHDAMGDN